MKTRYENVICRVKPVRLSKGLSQNELAELVGVKRQAIYDIESGKYAPNTALALRLAKQLGCKVEDLFYEELTDEEQPITVVEKTGRQGSRVEVAKVRGKLMGYPLAGKTSLMEGFRAADGLLKSDGSSVRLLCSEEVLDNSIMLMGCDPAFSILSAHVSRYSKEARLQCRFASSHRALRELVAGNTHLAGTHLHNTEESEANVQLAEHLLSGAKAMVIAFSGMEEGLLVAPGNPRRIQTVADLAKENVRLVNREQGAALRVLLDDYLSRLGIPREAIKGYDHEVMNHQEGAQMVAFGFADAALGFRAVAAAWGLDFTPLKAVRFDLIVPYDLLTHQTVKIVLDTLQSRKLRAELAALPGYESSQTGSVVAEL